MLGRGALISGLLVIVFLPPLLLLFDRYIQLLSLRMKFVKEGRAEELPDEIHDAALDESTTAQENGAAGQDEALGADRPQSDAEKPQNSG